MSAKSRTWKFYVDGSSNREGSGVGLLLESLEGQEFCYSLKFDFKASNNEAEYEALISRFRLAKKLGAQVLKTYSDSQLVVCQVLGEYEAKKNAMLKYLAQVKHLIGVFISFEIQRIHRSQNKHTDALSKLVSTSFLELNKTVLVKILSKSSYEENMICSVDLAYSAENLMTPIMNFLDNENLPEDKVFAQKIRKLVPRYTIIDAVLYRKSYSGPWLRCLTPKHGKKIFRSIHEGICKSHIGSRALIRKALLLRYF